MRKAGTAFVVASKTAKDTRKLNPASHTHDNKIVLDKITVVGGVVKYDGQDIAIPSKIDGGTF